MLGIPEAERVSRDLLAYAGLLLDANRQTNLVGAKTLEGLVAPHLLDSLAPLVDLRLEDPVIDLGSGAGLPGIPAAIAWPKVHFMLFEPRAKRAAFLRDAVRALELKNAEILQTSAHGANLREGGAAAGTVLARALAKPEKAIGLGLPLLRTGGRLVIYTGKAVSPGKAELTAIAANGGRLAEARPTIVPYLEGERHVWLIERTGRRPRSRKKP
jgi:16S rRNA (guanine527-N7)-methyltransferase